MITYLQATSNKELEQIIALQKNNLPENLSDKEKTEQGFLTVKHSLVMLKDMNNECPHTIAIHNNKVVGYALSMTKNFASEIEVLKPMFIEISKSVSEKKYIVMGQICIDKKFRKKGIFKGLYQFMKTNVCKDHFNMIITEIDVNNIRSLEAHKAVGFKKLQDYCVKEKNWRIITLKT
ncbi:GNAT family N-acetyltransferase [Polaribacter ponticola]|uniref:GNAT family N-acetyltransferase n=1 Tax=Polaribacter ponticola TaxID=2978475 RepID=A0ABT5SAS2_9FLAO|nr:GNAT family N-acetyltransferase [Polaribacter sp. MSW5]MDD7915219.1 GNAT family N-acetyltransferase [Polaribacter sp. MSW5]